MKAWIEYCFTNLGVHRVRAACDAGNPASEKVMINCGMKKEAELRLHRFQNGAWHDELQYAILKEEWE
jgi:ribosomal-protein-alanine N-acetyltransferase